MSLPGEGAAALAQWAASVVRRQDLVPRPPMTLEEQDRLVRLRDSVGSEGRPLTDEEQAFIQTLLLQRKLLVTDMHMLDIHTADLVVEEMKLELETVKPGE